MFSFNRSDKTIAICRGSIYTAGIPVKMKTLRANRTGCKIEDTKDVFGFRKGDCYDEILENL